MSPTSRPWAALVGTLTALSACASDVLVGAEHRGAVTTDGGGGAAGSGGAALDSSPACQETRCQTHLYACGNCSDDDGDGLVDMADPDCLGPCHNAEDTFFGSIPGQNAAGCLSDCYFDQDNGTGNDRCSGSQSCDALGPGGAECPYDPSSRDCAGPPAQPAPCLDFCGPLTPNGCDCFGCCSIPGAPTAVWVGSTDENRNPTCDLAHAGDPARCRPCTQDPSCTNPCDECELCVGKTSLPAACGGDAATPVCTRDNPCGLPRLQPCPENHSCITGCCTATIR